MPNLADEMASSGRTMSTSGNYKTRPGATQAWQDQREARPGDAFGKGLTAPDVWDSFFHKNDLSAGPTPQSAKNDIPSGIASGTPTPAATDWANPSSWEPSLAGEPSSLDGSYFDAITPSASNPDSYVQSALNSQDGYFNKLGAPIARPQLNTANMTVPPLPDPMAITGNSSGYDNAFGATPALPDQPLDFSMDQEL